MREDASVFADTYAVTAIYHITHLDNLPRILTEGGLVCDTESERRELCAQSIAHATLKERRARTSVEKNDGSSIAAGGVLADYVPFYFTNRSPMLYAIHRGAVVGYNGGQSSVIYLVSSVETVAATKMPWCFTDGHAVEEVSEFYDRVADLNQIDSNLMQNWSWQNTLSDPDRKRRKQAEFLVHQQFPWRHVTQISVINQATATQVKALIQANEHQPRVTVEPKWYYN
jgi:ssDNA thymidine ADP-ribosyltransferase, DarT